MTQFTRQLLKIALLLFVISAITLACSSTSQQSPLKVEDVLATMTWMVWTATPPATATPLASPTATITPTPTETPLPTITPIPSFDWCKGMNTRLAKEQDIKVGPARGDEGFAAFACLVEVVGPSRGDFPETALLVKLGFNDKGGVLHIYSAVIGGMVYTKPKLEEFKYPACYAKEPQQLTLDEFQASLTPFMSLEGGAKEFPVFVYTKLGYVSHSPTEASFVNRYADLHQVLENAVKTGEGFPQVPERYRLFILPGLKPCP